MSFIISSINKILTNVEASHDKFLVNHPIWLRIIFGVAIIFFSVIYFKIVLMSTSPIGGQDMQWYPAVQFWSGINPYDAFLKKYDTFM